MVVRKQMLDSAKYPLKSPYSMAYEFVCIHNTDNDAPAINEIKYMTSNSGATSFHYAVDDKEIVQGIPDNRNAWHAGDGSGPGNRRALSIEICYSKSGGAKFDEAEKLGAKLAAVKLHAIGKGVERLTKHQDYNGKNCPSRTLSKGWERFKGMVQAEINLLKEDEMDRKMDTAEKWAVDNGIMRDEKWEEPATRSQMAWWLFDMWKKFLKEK